MPTPTGITVEPHMVERAIPGWYDKLNMMSHPEQRVEEQKGWNARRGSLTAWSTSRDAACVMLGFMEGRKSASKGEATAPEERLRAAVTEACASFSGDRIERIVAEQLERQDHNPEEGS